MILAAFKELAGRRWVGVLCPMPVPEFRQAILPQLPVVAVGGHSDQCVLPTLRREQAYMAPGAGVSFELRSWVGRNGQGSSVGQMGSLGRRLLTDCSLLCGREM